MDVFQKKTLNTSRGYTYTYYVADGDKSLPTLIFQHGWPDHAAIWKDVATGLRSTNHPMIIPDLLGYDGTDKPTNPAEYAFDKMTKDVIEIADAEDAPKVVSIGHDWGSGLASRLYNHYPDRVIGLINLNVAYMPPTGDHFDLDKFNAVIKEHMGAALFSYWGVFAAEDGPKLLYDNLERTFRAQHGQGKTMAELFTVEGAMRNYLINGGHEYELRTYAQDPAFKKTFIDRMTRDRFDGPQCWYRAMVQNVQSASDKELPTDRKVVKVPALYIGCHDDPVCRPETMAPYKAQLLPHLEEAEMIDAAHWVLYEAPDEVVKRIEPWLKKTFGKQ
ncbi:alpha/beta-hydrolase [Macroventuria anomochaeta]|uniref:Alpha/beta-hydrolase n=1 Tax=Macroventuria anomochaeta TaxID=301207 RepID=A0ACB6S5U4_9PLEO|nr:alpha/beta-hydrolase [Macroventuria anomochaeta]KAF2629419.1 alpha/beta-hydrolase [Macroventuria anomochaeta]